MAPAPAHLRRHFLPWDQPLLPQAVAWLAADWDEKGPLDLSRWIVVVPTAQSGRRLREALADRAHAAGQAALPPRVMTPDGLIALPVAGVASRVQALLAWTEVFRALDPAEFREVFPVDPPTRNFSWALRLAEQFGKLQAELAEGGLRMADVGSLGVGRIIPNPPGMRTNADGANGGLGITRPTQDDFPEAARWTQLAALENLHAEKLATLGLRDPQAAKIAAANEPPTLPVEKIVLLAVPDPMPLALTALAAHAGRLPVEIVVFAPPAEAGAFDEWGRPSVSVWEKRELPLADFENRVHLCADPADQAGKLVALASAYPAPAGRLGLGVADAEVLPLLEAALIRTEIPSFNPQGQSRRRDRLFHLLRCLSALAQEPSFEAVAALARCPDVMDFLAARLGAGFAPARWLKGLDELRSQHLPADLAAAREHAVKLEKFPVLAPALAAIGELREGLTGGAFAAGAAQALAAIFSARQFHLARESDGRFQESAAAWMDLVRECAGATASLSTAEWWELALQLFGDRMRAEDKPAGAVELQGWLELLFEDAPHLAVAGLNDGSVPDAVVGDAFLPEALRARLGLKTNAARLSRDAYLLTALDVCRRREGRLDLLAGKVSAAGDPLRPSRLLLQCRDEELPGRVSFLFRDLAAGPPGPAWRRGWRLRQPEPPKFERLKVTAFRDYLQCPFRFQLRHALDVSSFDPQKSEWDAADFGTLCHGALEDMANDPGLRDSEDAPELRQFLHRALDRRVCARYGANLPLPLLIQAESARQRLAQAAKVQAEQRAQGWAIEEVEKKFSLQIGRIWVDGKIDRIERHRETGQRRILDYKTSDQPVSPGEAHAARMGRRAESAPEFARFKIGGKERVWTDLQLPLYLEAMGEGVAGYFNLPKAAGETAIAVWEDYDDEWRAAARRCAEGVVAAITEGIFWPPAELPAREDSLFAGWFHQGTAASVERAAAGKGAGA